MTTFSRMPRYDVRNDGLGPYAVFYCETCSREFRSQPNVASTITQDLGKKAMGGLLRRVPLVGNVVADNVVGEDPQYSYKLTPEQVEKAWQQVQINFRECPTCLRIVCLSDFDTQSGYCNEDSPRKDQIAEAEGQQAGAALKGLASAFGLGGVVQQVAESVKNASQQTARCPQDGTIAPAGTKFCPECGSAMIQPQPPAAAAPTNCANCGAALHGAKFCPECGTKVEIKPVLTNCPNCGAETKGAKFCPECGQKLTA